MVAQRMPRKSEPATTAWSRMPRQVANQQLHEPQSSSACQGTEHPSDTGKRQGQELLRMICGCQAEKKELENERETDYHEKQQKMLGANLLRMLSAPQLPEHSQAKTVQPQNDGHDVHQTCAQSESGEKQAQSVNGKAGDVVLSLESSVELQPSLLMRRRRNTVPEPASSGNGMFATVPAANFALQSAPAPRSSGPFLPHPIQLPASPHLPIPMLSPGCGSPSFPLEPVAPPPGLAGPAPQPLLQCHRSPQTTSSPQLCMSPCNHLLNAARPPAFPMAFSPFSGFPTPPNQFSGFPPQQSTIPPPPPMEAPRLPQGSSVPEPPSHSMEPSESWPLPPNPALEAICAVASIGSPCHQAPRDGHCAKMSLTPSSPWSGSAWGNSIPDIAGGWRRHSLSTTPVAPTRETHEEKSEETNDECDAPKEMPKPKTGAQEKDEQEQEEDEEMQDSDEDELAPLEDLHCMPQHCQSWEYPLSKSEKTVLYNRLCDQERAAVVQRYNHLVRRVSISGHISDDDVSEPEFEEKEGNDEEVKKLRLKQKDLEKELESVRNERRRLSTSRRLSY